MKIMDIAGLYSKHRGEGSDETLSPVQERNIFVS
jgi:hypothetical protein